MHQSACADLRPCLALPPPAAVWDRLEAENAEWFAGYRQQLKTLVRRSWVSAKRVILACLRCGWRAVGGWGQPGCQPAGNTLGAPPRLALV